MNYVIGKPQVLFLQRNWNCVVGKVEDIREAFANGIRAKHIRHLDIFGRAPSGRAIRSKSSRFPTAPGFPLLSLTQAENLI